MKFTNFRPHPGNRLKSLFRGRRSQSAAASATPQEKAYQQSHPRPNVKIPDLDVNLGALMGSMMPTRVGAPAAPYRRYRRRSGKAVPNRKGTYRAKCWKKKHRQRRRKRKGAVARRHRRAGRSLTWS